MKKSVLMVLLAAAVTVNAQNRIARNVTKYGPATRTSAMKALEPSLEKSNAGIPSVAAEQKHQMTRKFAKGSGNHTQTICETPIGSAGNTFGAAFGPRTNLSFNRDLNTLTFIHRANPIGTSATIGFIEYDYSTDGGITWNLNHQYIYRDLTYNSTTGAQDQRGRYPQGGLYNPPGNTDPANSYMTGYGPVTDAAAATNNGWPWHYEGTQQLGGSSNNQMLFSADIDSGGLGATIPQGGTIVKSTGETWWSSQGYYLTDYDDTVVLSHGVYNGAGDMAYDFKKVHIPVCTDIDGGKMIQNCAVIFNDAGTTGYIVVLGNDWVCDLEPQDSSIGIIIYKSTDSGNSWNKLHSPDINLLDPVLLNGGYAYQTGTQLDLGLDGNDHLHIVLPIIPFQPGNTVYLAYNYGSYGIFDVSTTDDYHYTACLIVKPMTLFGMFGTQGNTTTDPEIDEDNRAQFSRSWDGSKIFYTWFDTDTSLFPGLNNFPDARCIGRDLDGDLWTAENNLTEATGTFADGSSLFGNVSYYTINDGTNENIPLVVNNLSSQPNGTANAVSFYYEGCNAITNYVNTGNCLDITGFLGIDNPSRNSAFNVSSNYPNPFNGNTTVDVTLANGSDVTIEISNALGQVVRTMTYKNLTAGLHPLTIDGSALSKGLYFYTVKAGSDSATRSMSVE